MALGAHPAGGAQCQPPAATVPSTAGLPGQAPCLGLTLQPFTALMAQLSEDLGGHHPVSSSLSSSVGRVGLCKWARFRCSRNEPSFLPRITDADVQTPG